jgi:hypothetical protein
MQKKEEPRVTPFKIAKARLRLRELTQEVSFTPTNLESFGEKFHLSARRPVTATSDSCPCRTITQA